MASSVSKLDQAMKDLLDAYISLEDQVDANHSEDDDAFSSAILEALEIAIESALDKMEVPSQTMAALVSAMSEALEQLDPSAFDDEDDGDFGMSDANYEIDDEDDSDMDIE